MHRARLSLLLPLLLAVFVQTSSGQERTISSAELLDKLHGMWLGQLLGNAAGRATEGVYSGPEPNPNPSVPWVIKQAWDADDDTDIEYVTLHILESCGFDCDANDIAGQWLDHVSPEGIFIANRQAWCLMRDGYRPPQTGSRHYNPHWYSIDAQIGTELLGALSPGMPQTAIDLAGRFGRVTNAGFAVHAAQFYATLYAEAFFEPNVPTLVFNALAALPPDSRTTQVIADICDWYRQDALDGVLDWRATRDKLYENYQGPRSFGRYYNWVESTINTGATVLALLYGQGNFERTVQIAVLAGWDCDCNPATAGGLLGIIHGLTGLPRSLTDPNICGDSYLNVARPGLPDPRAPLPQSESIQGIAQRTLALAQENILRNGGRITPGRFTSYCRIPRHDPPHVNTHRPAILGPDDLVATAIEAGLSVTAHASVARFDPTRDRNNLASIIDGAIDNSHNGVKPYWTNDPADPSAPSETWFEVRFSSPVVLTGVTLYGGDLVWAHINTYYRDDQPLGGPVEAIDVAILRDDVYLTPSDIALSPPEGWLPIYQTITVTFAPAVADGIRLTCTPARGGRFATILELSPHGAILPSPDAQVAPSFRR